MADEIHLPPGTNAPVIKIGDKCYQRVGPSDQPPDVSSDDGQFSDCESCESSSNSNSRSGSGCSDCPSDRDCGVCGDGGLGLTPTRFTVAFTGVEIDTDCWGHDRCVGDPRRVVGGPLGTYTLVQSEDDSCVYVYEDDGSGHSFILMMEAW